MVCYFTSVRYICFFWNNIQISVSLLQFHLLSMLEHVRNQQIGSREIEAAKIAFQLPVRIVRFQVASKMSRSSVAFLAVFDDASVVSRRGNLVGAGVAAFQAGTLGAGSAAVFQS